MKLRVCHAAIFFCCLLIVETVCSLAQQAPSPAASFSDTRYEFRTTPDGPEIMHDFIVKNTGDATLNIQKVKSG
ncbi:MAG: hypothetical protein PHP23_13470 [Desulfobacterales bacterium]|nr:hypothetical protein [Desulfobacterales bacterium]MDD4073322.1 hypothetical protein [Desulfobacterales bacterium]MDD4391350.1 hypothetical protein [Desulfobacterales bacterium]